MNINYIISLRINGLRTRNISAACRVGWIKPPGTYDGCQQFGKFWPGKTRVSQIYEIMILII